MNRLINEEVELTGIYSKKGVTEEDYKSKNLHPDHLQMNHQRINLQVTTCKQEHVLNRKKVFLAIIIIGLLIVYFLLLSNILAAPSVMKGIVISDSRILSDDGKTYKIINSENTFNSPDCSWKKRVEVVGIVEDFGRGN